MPTQVLMIAVSALRSGSVRRERGKSWGCFSWWHSLKNPHATFPHGRGISHIIAKRDWEGKYIQEFPGQSGDAVAYKLMKFWQKEEQRVIRWREYEAFLSRPENWEQKEEEWLLSGYALDTEGYHHILEVKAKAEITESVDENGGNASPLSPNGTPFLRINCLMSLISQWLPQIP